MMAELPAAPSGDATNPATVSRLDSEPQDHIARRIRELYASVVDAPLPDRLVTLIDALDREHGRQP